EIITLEIPEWKIIDDATWAAVQQKIVERKLEAPRMEARPSRYALSGVARCASCQGPIGITKAKRIGGEWVRAYGCTWHHARGNAVCSATHRQDAEEVELAFADFAQNVVI